MLINKLASKYNISIRTLRYYDEIELLKSNRNESNIRIYDLSQIERLELILLFKMFNFNLSSIREILNSKDNHLLNVSLHDELHSISNKLSELGHKKQLIQSLIQSFGKEEISKSTIRRFIQKQLYFNINDERTISMIEKSDSTILEIGVGLIPIASNELGEPLLKAIKETREKLEKIYSEKLKLVRVRDNEDLEPLAYQIIFESEIITKSKVTSNDYNEQVSTIIESLKPYLLLAKQN